MAISLFLTSLMVGASSLNATATLPQFDCGNGVCDHTFHMNDTAIFNEDLIVDDITAFENFINPEEFEDPVAVDSPSIPAYSATYFNTKSYFENLKTYSPINNIGSCGYVSLIQLMSYYDSFFNDSVYYENFEYKNSSSISYQQAELDSPGVIGEYWTSKGYSSYYEYCLNSFGYNLQSHLTTLNNLVYGTNNPDDFSYSIGAWSYQNMLNLFYGRSDTVQVQNYSNKSQSEYINLIKDSIDEGHPVVVHVNNTPGQSGGGHSVVAYDYDMAGIYAHYGWGSTSTKYQLLGSYNNIYWVSKLDYSNLKHSHSNNYIINGKGSCGCNLNDEVKVSSGGNSIFNPPTLYWMDDRYVPTSARVKIQTNDGMLTLIPSTNSVILTQQQWNSICALSGGTYIVNLTRIVNGIEYASKDTILSLPSISSLVNVSQEEYGFEPQYFFGVKTKNHVINGVSFSTTRLRTGFIEEEFVNLSPNREGAGTAYIEYTFSKPIFKFDIEMSFWSANEGLNSNTGYAQIQYWTGTAWQTEIDILNDYQLSTNRNNQQTYTINFPVSTTKFRIISGVNNPSGTRNLGRISLGEIEVYSRG